MFYESLESFVAFLYILVHLEILCCLCMTSMPDGFVFVQIVCRLCCVGTYQATEIGGSRMDLFRFICISLCTINNKSEGFGVIT